MSEQNDSEFNPGFLIGVFIGIGLGWLVSWLMEELERRYQIPGTPAPAQPETITQVVEVERPDPNTLAKLEAAHAKIRQLENQLKAVPAPAARAKRPAKEVKDDLTAIKGIGPKTALALQEAGYTTFAAVAAATREELRAVLDAAGMPQGINPATWPGQARELS